MREVLETEMLHQLADRFGGVDATARAAAFGAQLAGLIVARCWLAIGPPHQCLSMSWWASLPPGLHGAMPGPAGVHRPVGDCRRPPVTH